MPHAAYGGLGADHGDIELRLDGQVHETCTEASLDPNIGLNAFILPRAVAVLLRLLQGCILSPQLAVLDTQAVVFPGHVRFLRVELRDHRGELLTFRLFPHA